MRPLFLALDPAKTLSKSPSLNVMSDHNPISYRRSSIRIVLSLLAVWFTASFVCAILARDWLDEHLPSIGNAPFGFWMSQQGAIIVFIILLIVYRFLMNRLDRQHGLVDPE